MSGISNIQRQLTLADVGTRLRVTITAFTPVKVTIPPESSVSWPAGAWVEIIYFGSSQSLINIIGEFGVTVNQVSGTDSLVAGQVARLHKVSGVANTWDLHVQALVPPATGAGLVFTSTGNGSEGYWTAPQVPTAVPTQMFTLQDSVVMNGFFHSFNSITGITSVVGPVAIDNTYSDTFVVDASGIYEVKINSRFEATVGSPVLLPNGLLAYGLNLTSNQGIGALLSAPTTYHTRFSGPTLNAETNFGLQDQFSDAVPAASTVTFDDTFIVNVPAGATMKIRFYVKGYGNTDDVNARLIASFKRIGNLEIGV